MKSILFLTIATFTGICAPTTSKGSIVKSVTSSLIESKEMLPPATPLSEPTKTPLPETTSFSSYESAADGTLLNCVIASALAITALYAGFCLGASTTRRGVKLGMRATNQREEERKEAE